MNAHPGVLFTAAALLALVAGTPTAPARGADPSPPPGGDPSPRRAIEHRIGIRQVDGVGEFYDRATGLRFTPRGANHVFVPAPDGGVELRLFKVGTYDPAQHRADFGALAAAGFNTVRVFLDDCAAGPGCIGISGGDGLDGAYLDNVADLLRAADEAGLVVLLTSNDLPDDGGYSQEANAASGPDFAGYRNSFYLTPAAIRATRRYWHDLVSGLLARDAPLRSVLGWQLVNEQWMFADQPPLSLRSGRVTTTTGSYDMADAAQRLRMVADGLVHYIAQVREEIRSLDPDGLVTMGFFVPELVAPGWFTDTAPLLERADLDFFDFHLYPGPLSLRDHARAFGMIGYTKKPIIMGEVGAFRDRYPGLDEAARALAGWIAESCRLGFDGWLHWTYRAAGPDAGDRTWGLTDADGHLLQLLGPAAQPDPCIPPEIADTDLAHAARLLASSSLPTDRPSRAADGDAETIWNSGAGPVQWIELRLDRPSRIRAIRLLVSQYPAGPTIHHVDIRRIGEPGFTRVATFRGETDDGRWLSRRFSPPLRDVTVVRITTIASPSWVAWREIEVLDEGAA